MSTDKLNNIINAYENFSINILKESSIINDSEIQTVIFCPNGPIPMYLKDVLYTHKCSKCSRNCLLRAEEYDKEIKISLKCLFAKKEYNANNVNKNDIFISLIENLSALEKLQLLKLITNKNTWYSFLRYMGMDSNMDLDNLYYIQKVSNPVLAVQETTYSENKYTYKGIMIAPKNTIKVNDLVEVLWEDDNRVLVYKDSGEYLIDKNCISSIVLDKDKTGGECNDSPKVSE